MRCPNCEVENPEGMKFCGQCATPLSLLCPQCGFKNLPHFKFCGRCGTLLRGRTPDERTAQSQEQERKKAPGLSVIPPATADARRASPDAERRHLTVMFCDQVNSVGRAERLDPEEVSEIARQYQEVCATVIRNFEGYIGQYQGDGLLAYFGYPLAHEDDAHRSLRAGLGILAELPHLNAQLQKTMKDLQDFPLQLRIGIHTGLVVVGEMGAGERHELMALGDTPNLASRLQGIAAPDTVLISEDTYRLTRGFFECRALGPQQLKGVSQRLEVYQVIGESAQQSRFLVSTTAGLTPLVGRKEELRLLLERWEQIKEGEGGVVMLSGEAGIGKSRLAQALKERLSTEPHLWLECHCSPYHQNSALYPVIELLRRLLPFTQADSPEEKFGKLESVLQRFPLSLLEIMPLFASLLSLPLPDHYPPLTLAPQRQRQKLQEALIALLVAQTRQQPLLLIVEDLHWTDPSTLETLNFLVNQGPLARSLTLLTFRPEFTPPWVARSHVTHLTLSRLSRKQGEEMLERVTKGKTLPPEVTYQLVIKTDGVPLFVEELTKMVLESGWLREEADRYTLTRPFPVVGIPATLHDSLMARLDRLGPVKEVAQLGATLGREFPYELLKAVSPLNETDLQDALNQLVEAELLYRRILPSHELYVFKHALIQETAHQSLLKSTRRHYHEQIARVLQEGFFEIQETQPELLAHHYTEAGLIQQALPYWQKAGQRAVERSANLEAIGHLTTGLELLKTLPDTVERVQQELSLQIALGVPLMATRGFAASEVENVYARARVLCQRLGETLQLFPVLWGLWAFYAVRVEPLAIHELGEQLLRLAEREQNPIFLVVANRALGQNLYFLGEFSLAQARLDQALTLYDPVQHRSQVLQYGQDQGVISLSFAAWNLWALGYPEQALRRSNEAVSLARELRHPLSHAFALVFAAILHAWRREWTMVQAQAEAAMALATEQGLTFWLTLGTFYRGFALVEQQQQEEGLAQMRRGIAAYRAAGAELGKPGYLFALAQACGKAGQIEEGLQVLAEALATVDRTKAHAYETEVYRIKGELMLQQFHMSGATFPVPDPQSLPPPLPLDLLAEAEVCFRQALEIARRQNAKSLELRAAMSLSRLWRQQGKTEDARRLLAEIHGWFTEGFDTVDLQEAASLLGELSSS